jgi:hypothetical protein
MSTLAVTNLKHESATGNNIVLASDGTATFAEIITASKGIAFPATQVASANANTLDDYEEGTWTPTFIGSTTAGTATYTGQLGTYTKIGNRVYIRGFVGWSAHTGTGNGLIGGLPFNRLDVNSVFNIAAANYTYTAGATLIGYGGPGAVSTSQIGIYEVSNGNTVTAVALDSSAFIVITAFYEVA